jgi:heme A synthase
MDRFARLAASVLAYNVAVILWGAVVRATGAGAGCGSHWPLCNGEMVPRAPAAATLIEFSHRLTSGIALLLVVALLVAAFRARPRRHPARGAAAASLVLMLLEAAIGAGLVLFELVAENRSLARGFFMATHLVNTFLLLGALTLTAYHAAGGPAVRPRGPRAPLFALALAGVLLASASGAVAALGDTLFPSQSLVEALRADLSAASHALIRLRTLHPFLAVLSAFAIAGVAWPSAQAAGTGIGRLARGLLTVTFVQTAAGAVNVLLLAPIWLQIVHLLLADAVWILLVLLAASELGEAGEKVAARPRPAVAPAQAAP